MTRMRKDFIITAFGIGGGQLVLLAFTPFLARVYSPDEFGAYAAVMALAAVLASVSSLRYETSIPVVSENDIAAIGRLAVILPFIICPLMLAAITGFEVLFPSFGQAIPSGSRVIVAIVGTLQGVVAVAYALCTRHGQFVVASALRMLQPVAFVAGALFLFGDLQTGLAFSWAITLAVGVYQFRSLKLISGWKETFRVASREWRYPVLFAPVSLLDNLTLAIPLLSIVAIFGEHDAGNYAQAQRLIGAPMLLIGMATGQVFFKHTGDRMRNSLPLETIFFKTFKGLSILGIGLLILVWIDGEWIASLLLGKGWRVNTIFLLLVVLPIVFRATVSPLTSIFLICNKLKVVAGWQVSYFLMMGIIVLLASKRLSFEGYLFAIMLGEMFMYSCYFLLAVMVVRQFDGNQKGTDHVESTS